MSWIKNLGRYRHEAQQEWHNRVKPMSLKHKYMGGERETLCSLSHISIP